MSDAVADQILHNTGVGQGRGIAQAIQLIAGNLAQDAAHDLARAGFWQARRPLHELGTGKGADLIGNKGLQLLDQLLARLDTVHRGDVDIDALALDVVRAAHHGGFGNGVVQYQRALHLGGADPDNPAAAVVEVLLSRTGRIWSFTNSAYPPPPPFILTEPYVPVVVAAVELEVERMVVLGQVAPGWTVEDLEVDMEVELVLGVLYEDDEREYLTWQWRPVGPSADGRV